MDIETRDIVRQCSHCGLVWLAPAVGQQPQTCPYGCHALVLPQDPSPVSPTK
jgi:hypothetical protein